MMDADEVRALIDVIFEEQALVIGGLAALHPADEQFIVRLMRHMKVMRRRALSALSMMAIANSEPQRAMTSRLTMRRVMRGTLPQTP